MGEDRSQQERTEASVWQAQCGESHSWPENKLSGESSLEAEQRLPGLDTVAQALTKVLLSYHFPPSVKQLNSRVWKSK